MRPAIIITMCCLFVTLIALFGGLVFVSDKTYCTGMTPPPDQSCTPYYLDQPLVTVSPGFVWAVGGAVAAEVVVLGVLVAARRRRSHADADLP